MLLTLKICSFIVINTSVVFVTDIDMTYLEFLINFAYTGELDLSIVPKKAMWPILSACTELQMMDAPNLCHDYMSNIPSN